jgi:hypothetical protein
VAYITVSKLTCESISLSAAKIKDFDGISKFFVEKCKNS